MQNQWHLPIAPETDAVLDVAAAPAPDLPVEATAVAGPIETDTGPEPAPLEDLDDRRSASYAVE